MKKTSILILATIILTSCGSNSNTSEINKKYSSLEKIELDNSGSVVSVKTVKGEEVDVTSFSEDDWGIYKYRMDGLIGRVVRVNELPNGNFNHDILISLKDKNKIPKIKELKDGEINSRIIEKEKLADSVYLNF